MWAIFLSLLRISYNIASVLCFGFLGNEPCGILAPQPGIILIPLALERKVLSPGLPGKSPKVNCCYYFMLCAAGTPCSIQNPSEP